MKVRLGLVMLGEVSKVLLVKVRLGSLTSGFIGGPSASKRLLYLKQVAASSPLPKSTALKTSEKLSK